MNTKIEKKWKEKKTIVFPENKFWNTKMKNKKNGFAIKRPQKRSAHGFGPCISNTRLDMLWGTLTDKLFREKWPRRRRENFLANI